jgi:hypothetical protein
MTKTFTKDDVVRFLYAEMNEDERVEMRESLRADIDLKTDLEEMKETKSLLDGFSMKASSEVVSRILYASKNLQSA